MRLENLYIGMYIKNYKELCKVLEADTKTGRAKQNQMVWFKEHFLFEKKGYGFTITEILTTKVKPMQDNRGGANNTVEYIGSIEKLLLDLLVQSKDNSITLSKNQLLHQLQMINENYSSCTANSLRLLKLSKFMDINQLNVQDWYDSTSNMLERNLQQALRNLEKQLLIFWSREMTVCVIEPNTQVSNGKVKVNREIIEDEYREEIIRYDIDSRVEPKYRQATKDEVEFILETEKKTLKIMSMEDKQELIRSGRWNEFDKQVKEEIFNKYNIAFYYKSYHIIANRKYVREKWAELEGLDFSDETREREQELLNEAIQDRVLGNAVNRHNTAKEKIETQFVVSRYNRRAEGKYIQDTQKLNSRLISTDSDNIIKDVIQTRLN